LGLPAQSFAANGAIYHDLGERVNADLLMSLSEWRCDGKLSKLVRMG
jgi:hypothetical protein